MLPRLRAVAIVGISALGMASCGGLRDNGVEKLGAAAILATARAAADGASSVHALGSIKNGSSKTVFDLDLVAGIGGRGQLSEGGLGFGLIALKATAYVNGGPGFYERFAGPRAANRLAGKWLKASTASAGFRGLGALTRQRTLLDTALAGRGALRAVGTATVNGERVVRLGAGDGGTFAIATTGTPYPVEVTEPGVDGGTISFDRWNVPVKLSAPAESVDIATLKRAAKAGG